MSAINKLSYYVHNNETTTRSDSQAYVSVSDNNVFQAKQSKSL